MKTRAHIISSLFLMPSVFFYTKNYFFSIIAGIITILIDFDHIIDYIITQKKIVSLNVVHKSFESFKYVKKNYFIFHSWEIAFCLLTFYYIYKDIIFLIFLIAFVLHLVLDQIYNTLLLKKYNLKNFFYFFFYRLYYKFDVLALRKNGNIIDENELIYE